MKIKSIENFTIEECYEYLQLHPDEADREAVEARINAIKAEEMKRIRLEQIRLKKDVKWIDIKQFLDKSNDVYYRLFKDLEWTVGLPILGFILGVGGVLEGWILVAIPIFLYLLLFEFVFLSRLSSLHRIDFIESEEKIQ